MPNGKKRLPKSKKEEQGPILTRLKDLAPLLQLILQALELILNLLRMID